MGENVEETNDFTEKVGEPDENLEKCDVCDSYAVVVNGRCKTCMECGNSLCSI